MRLLSLLRPAPRPAEPAAALPPGAYPWTSFPRGRRPTDAEVEAILARSALRAAPPVPATTAA